MSLDALSDYALRGYARACLALAMRGTVPTAHREWTLATRELARRAAECWVARDLRCWQ